MEGWRQERLGSRAGTHREKEKDKNILARKKEKTYLTLTGLLMEGARLQVSLKSPCRLAILRFVMCPILQKPELAVHCGEAEGQYRHFIRRTYLDGTDCTADDAFLAFADQAVAEAEVRATEARFALDEHTARCRLCRMANSN
jgi:hypothetical protein